MPSLADRYGLEDYPWEKLEGETDRAFAAFNVYRELGAKRTLRDAAAAFYGIPPSEFDPKGGKARNVEKWSSRFKWVQRCEEFDGWMQAVKDRDAADAVISMKARHAGIAAAASSKIIAAINELDATKLNGLQLLQMFDLVVKNERLARDVPNDITALTNREGGALEFANITDEALESKLRAWQASKDPSNAIEKGEPDGDDEDVLPEV